MIEARATEAVSRALLLSFAAAVVAIPRPALAEESEHRSASRALLDGRRLSAHPDSPVSSAVFRRQLRGKVGIVIPFVGEPGGEGFFLTAPAFMELHNEVASFVPYQYWRGRIAAEAGYRWSLGPSSALALSAALEHESDHSSSGHTGFVNLNGGSVRVDWARAFGGSYLMASLYPRLHLLTCTVSQIVCGDGGGRAGSPSFEQVGELVLDAAAWPWASGRLRPFAAVAGAWLLPHALAIEERRVTADLGVSLRTDSRGYFQVYLTSLLGDDVGFLRGTSSRAEAGVGFRWAP